MLQICLLGEQTVVDDAAGVLRLRSSRAIALIAYLVLHRRAPQHRQRIAGLFWPESSDAQALTNLRRELHHMRRVLEAGSALVVTPTDLCWQDTDTTRVDLITFDAALRAAQAASAHDDVDGVLAHADAALAQYRGELLPGVDDEWLQEPRAELERECVDLCDLVAATRMRTADLVGALPAARRRIVLRPLEEVGYRTLMELQAGLGDRAAAISTYHRCASVLEQELGVAPDQPTQAAVQRLLPRPHSSGAAPPAVKRGSGRSGTANSRLVGRSRELDRLDERWTSAAAGRPVLALVQGSAGVGKTRLVSEIAERARAHGAVVASSRCFGTSERLTLAPVADWLRNPAVQSAIATVDASWRAEVNRLLPTGPAPDGRAAGPRALADAWQHHRFFEGVARALLGVARPMLLVLDNIQWCDHETLDFLTFLLGLDPAAPVLVAATMRSESVDARSEFADWTVRMRAAGLLTELTLGPLDVADTAALTERISGRPLRHEDAELIQATTGGFPLYVIEAARTSLDRDGGSVPVGDLTAVLRRRLEQTSDTAREVAGLAAAVGSNFTLDLLTEASDLGADAVVQAVDELWRHRIVREFGDGYDFSHDLLRDAAYSQVSPPRRWLLHRRIAQGLELLHADDLDVVSAQLAEQYARGGRPERAVAYYRRAAEVAARMFAHAESIRLRERALSIIRAWPPGVDRDRQELSVLEAVAAPLNARFGYSSPRLQEALERSLELAETLGARESVLTALVGLWTSRFVQGRTAEAYETAARALALVESGYSRSGAAHFAVGGSAVSLGKPARAVHHLELAARLADGAVSISVGTRPDVHAAAWVAHAHWLLGEDAKARSSCRDAIAMARTIEHPYTLAVALAYGAITQQMDSNVSEVGRLVDELSALCERYDFAYYREWGLILGGWARGDEPGLDLARRGIDNLKAAGSLARMPYWQALLAELSARCGRPDAACAILDAALVTGRAHDDLWWLPEVTRLRAGYDDETAAVSRLEAAARMARAHGSLALLQRCTRDLERRGVRRVNGERPTS